MCVCVKEREREMLGLCYANQEASSCCDGTFVCSWRYEGVDDGNVPLEWNGGCLHTYIIAALAHCVGL